MSTDAPKPKRLKRFRLVRQAVDKISRRIVFQKRIPLCCRERCRRFDGGVCKLTGVEPETACLPAVNKIVELACSLDLVLFEERGPT